MIFHRPILHDPANFRSLRSKRISEYFPETLDSPENSQGLAHHIEFDDQVLVPFYKEFEHLIEYRIGLQGLSKSHNFKQWWIENRKGFLTKPVIQKYKDSGLTLGDLLDELHIYFMEIQAKKIQSSQIVHYLKKCIKNRLVVASVFSLLLLIPKLGQLIWSLIVLGPGVQMVNSYTQPVITPLAQTMVQKGSRDLAPIAVSIQSWLTHREKLKEVSRDLHKTTDKLKSFNFNKVSREEAQTKWAEFEQLYYELFLSYNQTLPSHLRDGRNFFRDWIVFTPIWIATSLSTFSNQYWSHRKEVDLINSKKRMRGGNLSVEDHRLKRLHTVEMEAAEDRIAGTLASWKLFEFMFPEFPKKSTPVKGTSDLRKSYTAFVKSMRFDLYIKQFSSQMDDVLTEIDAEFLRQDQLAQSMVIPKSSLRQ